MKTKWRIQSAEGLLFSLTALFLCVLPAGCRSLAHGRIQISLGQLRASSFIQTGRTMGQWEKVDMLPLGYPIVITLKVGDRINGTVKSSSPEILAVIDPSGRERNIRKLEVEKIVSAQNIKDGLGNGAIIGAGIGLGVALAILAGVASSAGEGEYVLRSAKVFAPVLGIGAGLGIGIAVDARHTEAQILYQASK